MRGHARSSVSRSRRRSMTPARSSATATAAPSRATAVRRRERMDTARNVTGLGLFVAARIPAAMAGGDAGVQNTPVSPGYRRMRRRTGRLSWRERVTPREGAAGSGLGASCRGRRAGRVANRRCVSVVAVGAPTPRPNSARGHIAHPRSPARRSNGSRRDLRRHRINRDGRLTGSPSSTRGGRSARRRGLRLGLRSPPRERAGRRPRGRGLSPSR